MAKKKTLNDRCPLQGECEKSCTFAGHELDCDYYHSFARPGYEIDDQEDLRFKRLDDQMLAEYMAADDEEDGQPDAAQRERWRLGDFTYPDDEEDAESPRAAENAAVCPQEPFEDILPPVEVLPASLHLDGATGVTEKIKKAMYDAASQFVYIGFLLWEVQEYGYYHEKGYSSVYEYAEAELGFKKSSTKNFIAINYEFGCRDNRPHGIAHERTMSLQPQYREFKYSQLCEMLSMSETQRKKVTPEMTVRQIRDLKREEEPDLPANMETIPIPLPDDGQTADQREDDRCHTLNNVWIPLGDVLIKELCTIAHVRYNPKSCYDITIKLHKG